MIKENLAKIGDLGCAKVIEEEIESPELPTNEKANLGDVAVKDPITPTKEEKMKDIDDNVMPAI